VARSEGEAECRILQAPSPRHAAGFADWSDLDREDLALAGYSKVRSHQDPANQSPAALADGKELADPLRPTFALSVRALPPYSSHAKRTNAPPGLLRC
jgi:hypothetical protein